MVQKTLIKSLIKIHQEIFYFCYLLFILLYLKYPLLGKMILWSSWNCLGLRFSRILSLSLSRRRSPHKSGSWQRLYLFLKFLSSLLDSPLHFLLQFINIPSNTFLILLSTFIKNSFLKWIQFNINTLTNISNFLLLFLHLRSETCHIFIYSNYNSPLQLLTNIMHNLLLHLHQSLSNIILKLLTTLPYPINIPIISTIITLLLTNKFRYCWKILLHSIFHKVKWYQIIMLQCKCTIH